ncbi:MAG: ferrous iron transport protein A [Desulfovibrio sp.]|nr:ferrous iron transport protein A [Desulfovibrio sp.]
MAERMNLRQLPLGKRGRIISVEAKGEMNRRIRDMGLIPGSSISVVGRAPLRDPIAVRLSGVTISLRNSEADCIEVEQA